MTRKKLIGLIAVISLVLMAVVIYTYSNGSTAEDLVKIQAKSQMEEYFKFQKGNIKLSKKLLKETPYDSIYGNVKSRELSGETRDKAIEGAVDDYIEQEAFIWYANENNIVVSDAKVEMHVLNLITEAKKADNYEEVEAACNKAGMTYEEFVRKNTDLYRVEIIKNILYMSEYDKYKSEKGVVDGEEFNGEWTIYKVNLISRFKQTERFEKLQKAVNNCVTLIESDVTDVSKIKNKDIYVGD